MKKDKVVPITAPVDVEIALVTPRMATKILEANKHNRPLRQQHVDRIADQILEGLWKFNGDTIKIATDQNVLDGQHRLWAIILADKAIKTVVVRGIHRSAFCTVDAIRKNRNGSDILAMNGVERHRQAISTGLGWLWRYQNQTLQTWRATRVENSTVEKMWAAHPDMAVAVEEVTGCRRILSHGVGGFLNYVLTTIDSERADKLFQTLVDPAGAALASPFYRYREYLVNSLENPRRRDPALMIALAFKAWNFDIQGKEIEHLMWRQRGPTSEKFPTPHASPHANKSVA